MAYTTINKSSLNFNTVLFTGNSTSRNITGVGFQPDFTWIKSRSQARDNVTLNSVVSGWTSPNNTYANNTDSNYAYTPISDGFTIGTANDVNGNGYLQCAWNWKAGGTASSNTNGTVTSTVSANNTNGFSIVKYTGTGSVLTIGHGLSSIPKMIMFKPLTATGDWYIHHTSTGVNGRLILNTANAVSDNTGFLNQVLPTSSLITVGTTGQVNTSGVDYIAYCFTEKTGYSKFGSYKGNGNANGPFAYTGFKPAFVLIKVASTTNDWEIHDNKRGPSNVINAILQPNLSDVESTSGREIDFLSNGFKLRNGSSQNNNSGSTFIYMAFGQSIVGSNNVPATAR